MQQAKAWGFDLHVLFCILSTLSLHCFCFLLLLCLTCFFTSLFELSCSFSEPDQTRPEHPGHPGHHPSGYPELILANASQAKRKCSFQLVFSSFPAADSIPPPSTPLPLLNSYWCCSCCCCIIFAPADCFTTNTVSLHVPQL